MGSPMQRHDFNSLLTHEDDILEHQLLPVQPPLGGLSSATDTAYTYGSVGLEYAIDPNLDDGPVIHDGFIPRPGPDSEYEIEAEGDDEDDEGLSMLPQSLRGRFAKGGFTLPRHQYETDRVSGDDDTSMSDTVDPTMKYGNPDQSVASGGSEYAQSSASEPGDSEDNLSTHSDYEVPDAGRGQGSKQPSRSRGRGRGRGRPRGRPRGRGHATAARGQGENTPTRGRPRGRARGAKYRRKMAQAGSEFNRLQNLANEAYIENRLEDALKYARQAVQANPEIFVSHSLLSTVLLDMGRKEDSLGALLSGAHTKRDPKLWWHIAEETLKLDGEERDAILGQAYYCFSQIIQLDKDDFEARSQRLAIQLARQKLRKARREAEMMLRLRPDDVDLLRQYAELCASTGDAKKALDAYKATIERFVKDPDPTETPFSWSILNVYLDLLDELDRYDEGISEMGRLSRLLLGRSAETYWSEQNDDSEWDFDDEPRRTRVHGFVSGRYSKAQYGDGLPLDIRIKLGLLRLGLFRTRRDEEQLIEAYRHFQVLEPEDQTDSPEVLNYDDLYREIGDALHDAELHTQALGFYRPLQKLGSQDAEFYLSLSSCYMTLGENEEALAILEKAAFEHQTDIPTRMKLVKIYLSMGRRKEAVELARKVTRLRARNRAPRLPSVREDRDDAAKDEDLERSIYGKTSRRRRRFGRYQRQAIPNHEQLLEQAQVRQIAMRGLYEQLLSVQDAMEAGDDEATASWMKAAEQLVDDFRSMGCFFPRRERWKFSGYRWRYAAEAEARVMITQSTHQQENSSSGQDENEGLDVPPDHLHNIPFDAWVDIFCRYGINVSKQGQKGKCEDIMTAALSANVFFQEDEHMVRIQTSYLACGLILSDEEVIYNASRFFYKTYPYAEDALRFFNATSRLYSGQRTWYNSGPSQKLILRQIKAMDFILLDPQHRELYEFVDVKRNTYSSTGKDAPGNQHGLVEMCTSLLTTYAHILASGGAYPSAINYYFRAWSLRPDDASLNLAISSAYIQHAMKRQSENRQFQVQQGIAFLFRYHEIRAAAGAPHIHVQEAEFNVGRMWSILGLQHLAVESFQRCLDLSPRVQADIEARHKAGEVMLVQEDFAVQAAYAIQTIQALAGDLSGAKKITSAWLVI